MSYLSLKWQAAGTSACLCMNLYLNILSSFVFHLFIYFNIIRQFKVIQTYSDTSEVNFMEISGERFHAYFALINYLFQEGF